MTRPSKAYLKELQWTIGIIFITLYGVGMVFAVIYSSIKECKDAKRKKQLLLMHDAIVLNDENGNHHSLVISMFDYLTLSHDERSHITRYGHEYTILQRQQN